LMIFRIEQDWYTLVQQIMNGNTKEADSARKSLRENLTSLAPVFGDKPFFLSDEFSLVDCALAPLLWRLPELGVELPSSAKPVLKYADRMSERESFQASMSESEREIREETDF